MGATQHRAQDTIRFVKQHLFAVTNCVRAPPNVCVDALTPNVTAFGDGACKGVTEVKRGRQGGALIPPAPLQEEETRGVHAQRKGPLRAPERRPGKPDLP